MSTFHLAQLNIAHLNEPLDHPATEEFVEALAPINQLAESSPGFVWRLTDEDGQSSSYVRLPGEDDDPLLIANYSIWEDLDSLKQFVFRTDHSVYLRRRREWFRKPTQPMTVLWWVPAGETPSIDEAYGRLKRLREHGPTAEAWTMARPFPPPGQANTDE